jgi:small subunit ribosomal protein S17
MVKETKPKAKVENKKPTTTDESKIRGSAKSKDLAGKQSLGVAKGVAKASPKKVAKPVKEAKIEAPKVVADKVKCEDINCPIHGNNKMRGRIFEGKVIRAKMTKTVTVEWPRRRYLSKYERFEKRRSKVKAHNPVCISAKEGDTVRISECRPLSKSKNFVILEVLN